jgi:hypothetical protein
MPGGHPRLLFVNFKWARRGRAEPVYANRRRRKADFGGQEASPGFQFECAEAHAKADKSGDNNVGSALGERLAHQRAREIALIPA